MNIAQKEVNNRIGRLLYHVQSTLIWLNIGNRVKKDVVKNNNVRKEEKHSFGTACSN